MNMTIPGQAEPNVIEGVFSIQKTAKIGTGATARRVQQTVYFFAREKEDGVIVLQGLSPENVPFGPKTEITKDELLQDYLPEPSKNKDVFAKLREVQKSVARGDKFRKRGETFTAEFEYSKALNIDEHNVRANFGIGTCYIQRGEMEKAREVFDRVLGIEAAFGDEHKHLFNEYGIQLRKAKMFDESVEYYERALELADKDENLFYNLARAEYERGENDKAKKALAQCLRLAPTHEEGVKMLKFFQKKGLL